MCATFLLSCFLLLTLYTESGPQLVIGTVGLVIALTLVFSIVTSGPRQEFTSVAILIALVLLYIFVALSFAVLVKYMRHYIVAAGQL